MKFLRSKGKCITILPGGFEEATLTEYGKDKVLDNYTVRYTSTKEKDLLNMHYNLVILFDPAIFLERPLLMITMDLEKE